MVHPHEYIKDRASQAAFWRADLASYGLVRWSWRYRWTRPEIYFVKRLRSIEFWRSASEQNRIALPAYVVARLRFKRLSERCGFTIPLRVFEGGLSIAHLGTIVVNSEAEVGRDCRLHPGVTIGANRGLAPRIGHEVFIGPGSGVFGGVEIGNRVHIGPGVIVTSDLPDDVILLPAQAVVRGRSRPTWRQDVRTRFGQDPEVIRG